MTKVNFYEEVQDELLKFAVIIAVSEGKLMLCKHKERDTWEVPGGHREAGEEILDTARSAPVRRLKYKQVKVLFWQSLANSQYTALEPKP